MRILVTGAAGQLGVEIVSAAKTAGLPVIPFYRHDLDIRNESAAAAAIARARPDIVVNAAAYTRVDAAETEPELAFAVNRNGPENLAKHCHNHHIPLIHVSTDYVFDGNKNSPYLETDPVSPINQYGAGKAAGEAAVMRRINRFVILRTSWLYGATGGNFVKTMLRAGAKRKQLTVVNDQIGAPTAAADLARAVLAVVGAVADRGEIPWGLYHYCGPEEVTWYDFAREIFDTARRFDYPRSPEITPIPTSEYPTPAARPLYSVLDCRKFISIFGLSPAPRRASLTAVVGRLAETGFWKEDAS
jgi:dTDP-4-dehydrorhamnose reductase